jgi:hypothetical protein
MLAYLQGKQENGKIGEEGEKGEMETRWGRRVKAKLTPFRGEV